MTQALETLLPCPRCGSEAYVTIRKSVWCSRDQCLRLPPRPTEAESIADWNTRKPCDAGLVERVARAICRAHAEFGGLTEDAVACQVENGWDLWEREARAAIASIHDQDGLREALESAGRALNRIAMIANEGSAVRLQAECEIGAIDRALSKGDATR